MGAEGRQNGGGGAAEWGRDDTVGGVAVGSAGVGHGGAGHGGAGHGGAGPGGAGHGGAGHGGAGHGGPWWAMVGQGGALWARVGRGQAIVGEGRAQGKGISWGIWWGSVGVYMKRVACGSGFCIENVTMSLSLRNVPLPLPKIFPLMNVPFVDVSTILVCPAT